MLKGTKLHSVFTGKCPVCQNTNMYKESNAYKLKSILDMHKTCSCCNVKYEREPWFFYGAMYVSYGVSVALAIAFFVLGFVVFELGILASFILLSIGLVLCIPLVQRLSRNIWVNIFFHYDKERAKCTPADSTAA